MNDEELLQQLLRLFYVRTGNVYFGYIDGTSIKDVCGKEVEDEVKKRLN